MSCIGPRYGSIRRKPGMEATEDIAAEQQKQRREQACYDAERCVRCQHGDRGLMSLSSMDVLCPEQSHILESFSSRNSTDGQNAHRQRRLPRNSVNLEVRSEGSKRKRFPQGGRQPTCPVTRCRTAKAEIQTSLAPLFELGPSGHRETMRRDGSAPLRAQRLSPEKPKAKSAIATCL